MASTMASTRTRTRTCGQASTGTKPMSRVSAKAASTGTIQIAATLAVLLILTRTITDASAFTTSTRTGAVTVQPLRNGAFDCPVGSASSHTSTHVCTSTSIDRMPLVEQPKACSRTCRPSPLRMQVGNEGHDESPRFSDSIDDATNNKPNREAQQQSNQPHANARKAIAKIVKLASSTLMAIMLVFVASTSLPDSYIVANGQDASIPTGKRYWSILQEPTSTPEQRTMANEALFDYVMGTINTMYYDNSGGAYFAPREFYARWREYRSVATHQEDLATMLKNSKVLSQDGLPQRMEMESREGAVEGLKWLVSSLGDPYSKYLTREDLRNELSQDADGFLGLGAIVRAPKAHDPSIIASHSQIPMDEPKLSNIKERTARSVAPTIPKASSSLSYSPSSPSASAATASKASSMNRELLSTTRVANLPVITAVAPESTAERSGLVVGDRIVAVGNHNFLGFTRNEVAKTLADKYSAENYLGHADITIAKPVYASRFVSQRSSAPTYVASASTTTSVRVESNMADMPFSMVDSQQEFVLGYRQTRVRLPTKAASTVTPYSSKAAVSGGDAIVHYELLTSSSGSIFDRYKVYNDPIRESDMQDDDLQQKTAFQQPRQQQQAQGQKEEDGGDKIGYIRLTRFSKASTQAFLDATNVLDEAGAQSYIIDLRNNYGGVIQEAMLLASTMLRDSHSILCYTLNSRGGFTPHDVEEFAVDRRYPGYLLSSESKTITLDQIRKESPAMFEENGITWTPPSSFASLHEQTMKRSIRSRVSQMYSGNANRVEAGCSDEDALNIRRFQNYEGLEPDILSQYRAQKNIVLLVNEGTASAAEVFASALHDNGRVVAMVGSKTYGKGLIQHTFPLPDGGGLRLTVAEYLTPSLRHVTKVGGAQFDRDTGTFVGGGIRPDIVCGSKQGIPSNIGADLCVGVALDALNEAVYDLESLPQGLADANVPNSRSSSQLVASSFPTLVSKWMSGLR